MTKSVLVLAAFLCLLSSGCMMNTRLYPVQGPLSSQTAPPVVAGRFTGGLKGGEFSAKLSDGEQVKGSWKQVSTAPSKGSNTPADSSSSVDLPSAWDAVYGKGFYLAHVLGQRIRVQGTMTGTRGTLLTVDAYRDVSDLNALKGVAVDSSGNVYKMAF